MSCSCGKADLKCTDLYLSCGCQITADKNHEEEYDKEEHDLARSNDEEELCDFDSDYGDGEK